MFPTLPHRLQVTAKMRIFDDIADTVAFATMLQDAGAAAVAVHGRRREQRHHEGSADWTAIAAVKAALRIPVIANGGFTSRTDAERCLNATRADAAMAATWLLTDPRMFCPSRQHEDNGQGRTTGWEWAWRGRQRGCREDGCVAAGCSTLRGRVDVCLEYLQCCRDHPEGTLPRMISDHLLTILRPDFDGYASRLKRACKDFHTLTNPDDFERLVRRVAALGGLDAGSGVPGAEVAVGTDQAVAVGGGQADGDASPPSPEANAAKRAGGGTGAIGRGRRPVGARKGHAKGRRVAPHLKAADEALRVALCRRHWRAQWLCCWPVCSAEQIRSVILLTLLAMTLAVFSAENSS